MRSLMLATISTDWGSCTHDKSGKVGLAGCSHVDFTVGFVPPVNGASSGTQLKL